ncbi:putative calcium/calmodulin-dependent serine protein kinase membrane-associated guanylate kinase [Operophtera brumata]|uniref:Putative calcium/calmodulin-dependent serine protein kinase membrane-associated guanylate kinase n=1 Tax=Operophtera brumata TaxID=104452 RepID=A0A0L7KU13_OPEBR|nr:putative calcium/calmodulin-dependent serine protein kinase membrane-associated guanylate kinase [Operophtera brumata]
MRTLFEYSPKEDTLIPCKEIGLEFKRGDILQISKKKKKFVYESRSSVQLEGAELALYEEVARTPPFLRRILALVGTKGVGRRTLKNRLIQENPDRFGASGQSYRFVSREEMERDAHAGRFLEHGEHNGHLYGTHLDSIRAVIKEGKMCILDCAPQSLKLLHTSSEFLPYVEEDMKQTLEDSSRIARQYEKYIDLVITNNNNDTTYSKILDALHSLSTDHQWVPVSWIY